MRRKRSASHALNILFPLLVYVLFALAAITIVLYAAGIYQRSVETASRNYALATARSYLQQKIRSCDTLGSISAGKLGELDALILADSEEDGLYESCVYLDGDSLKELYRKKDAEVDPASGTEILKLQAFSVSSGGDGLIRISCTDPDGHTLSFLTAQRSGRAA